jgi:folate-dependent phosphoribosylglycinamide formyltransferase PurN
MLTQIKAGQTAVSARDQGVREQGTTVDRRLRVVLCHLESLVCLPAINELFQGIGAEIGLVILSNRFGGRHGSAIRQLLKGIRRSGLRLTLWLGFDIVAARILSIIVDILGMRRQKLKSIRALAREHSTQLIETSDINAPDCLDAIGAYAPDVILVMNFDQIVKPPLIGIPALGVVNIHPSLLPVFRGPCPVFWALFEGSTKVGVTLHVIDGPEIDAGAVLDQWEMPAVPSSSVGEVTAQLFLEGACLAVSLLLDGRHREPLPQAANAAVYRTFPNYDDMVRARAQRLHLCRLSHLRRLVWAAIATS